MKTTLKKSLHEIGMKRLDELCIDIDNFDDETIVYIGQCCKIRKTIIFGRIGKRWAVYAEHDEYGNGFIAHIRVKGDETLFFSDNSKRRFHTERARRVAQERRTQGSGYYRSQIFNDALAGTYKKHKAPHVRIRTHIEFNMRVEKIKLYTNC